MKFIKKVGTVYKSIGATVFVSLLAPEAVYAAGPSDIASGVSDTEKLIGQGAQWLFGLILAGAVIFIMRALWAMHSADEDSQYSRGRKHLVRSIWTLIGAGCASAIVATIRSTYGF